MVRETNIKNPTCYFFNDLIKFKNLNLNINKIEENYTIIFLSTTLGM